MKKLYISFIGFILIVSSFFLHTTVSYSLDDVLFDVFSSVLSLEEKDELMNYDFFKELELDSALKALPRENTNYFYTNLHHILLLLSKDKNYYIEPFTSIIKNNFSYFIDIALYTKDISQLDKKILEFKYSHSIVNKLFILNEASDFAPVFFKLLFNNPSSQYLSNKTYITDTLDSWIKEEYLTPEFKTFLKNISPVESLDLLLVLYVLHNNIDNDNFIKIIRSNPNNLLVFKDFIYTISVYLKDDTLIKKFLSNPKLILNFFSINWDHNASYYFNHIINIANLIPSTDRINFILGIDTLYPIDPSYFKTHTELVLLIEDNLKDKTSTVLGSNYNLALNFNELKLLSRTLFLNDCYHLMSKKI